LYYGNMFILYANLLTMHGSSRMFDKIFLIVFHTHVRVAREKHESLKRALHGQ
jgi:hypothetical protein